MRKYNLCINRLNRESLDFHIFDKKQSENLPISIDLRSKMPPVYDQGQLGSCTANALCASYEYLSKKMGSRLFLYYNERKIENDINQDGGAELSDGIKSLCKNGICLESEWPYDTTKFAECPPEICYADALKNKTLKVKNIQNTLEGMKTCLSQGFPFVVGIKVYSEFETEEVAKTGMVPMPSATSQCLGGHAVCVVGYDDEKKLWGVRNSWGSANWGINGYFYLPYEYLTNSDLSSDLWAILSVEGEPEPEQK
jgi:C1A family cysteine protease